MELYLQQFVKIEYQHDSSVVNSTDIDRDINTHRPKWYLWRPCLHYSETFAWKRKNCIKCSGSLSTQYKSSSWKEEHLSINQLCLSFYKKAHGWTKKDFLCIRIHDTVGTITHLGLLSGLTPVIAPLFMLQRIVAEG